MLALLWLALAALPDTTPPAHLVLGDAYASAQARNPRAAAARALASAARARIPAAKLPPDPQVQLGFMNYTLPNLAPMDVIGMPQLQVMQMIPVAGKLGLSGRVATAQASAAGERAVEVQWDVRSRVAMSFYDVYATDQGLGVARETLRLLRDIRGIAEAMYRVGEGRQADVLRAQVEIARMVEDTIRMTTMRRAMAAQLNALLDRPADSIVAPPALPVFPDTAPPLEQLLAASETDRPMLRAGERDVEAAAAQARLARRDIWPDLTIGAQYARRGGAMGTERMGSLMLGASVPVFASRRQLKMRDEMAAMLEMTRAELAAMRAQNRSDVATAVASLTRARDLSRLYRTTIIPQAEATVASAVAAYRVGYVDFMTLLDDRMTANRYRQDLYTLEAEEGKAWAELEMLLGRELFDPNTTAPVRDGAGGNGND